jgi:thioredoxin reductase
MSRHTQLLIIGAGPFGLAMAAYAKAHDIDYLILGEPMEFWKSNMPKGMILRSACDWHLDPFNIHTIEHYLESRNQTPADVEPLSLEFYLSYAEWFQEQKQIDVLPTRVEKLDHLTGANNIFKATLEDGESITSDTVLIATGFKAFKHIPTELAQIIPTTRMSHTCDFVDFAGMNGKRCLIIGGRQSAFEWAALLHENGATTVHMSHRHETPPYEESDWSWVAPMVEEMVDNPSWFRNLPPKEKEEVTQRFWAEGRLKIEPWLSSRINIESIKIWPNSQIVACNTLASGELDVKLSTGDSFIVDQVILATGYKVNMKKVSLLGNESIQKKMKTLHGYPMLDDHFQSSISGLFFTSIPATQDFGPFFAFTVSVASSTKIVGSFIKKKVEKRNS